MASSAEALRLHVSASAAMARASAKIGIGQDSRDDRPGCEPALASLVETEIIPRLMLAHGLAPRMHASAVDATDVDRFAPLALAASARDLFEQVERVLARGIPVETIMVDLLAPVARKLGEWWEQDRCDFVEVTMGLWRLQEVLRELSARVPPRADQVCDGRSRRALMAAMPGDQHDFGTVMVGELFHRHGWEVATLPAADMPTILAEVGRSSYDLVGLTVSCDCHSARLPSAILAVRSVSRNPRVRVMVGGRVLVADPALAARSGADGTAPDAHQALAIAEALVEATRPAIAC